MAHEEPQEEDATPRRPHEQQQPPSRPHAHALRQAAATLAAGLTALGLVAWLGFVPTRGAGAVALAAGVPNVTASAGGTEFGAMMRQYEQASAAELEKAGVPPASQTGGGVLSCLNGGKGCMEKSSAAFNALKFMIWKRRQDPSESKGSMEEWADHAVDIAEHIAKDEARKSAAEKKQLKTVLNELGMAKGRLRPDMGGSALRRMFSAEEEKADKTEARLRKELRAAKRKDFEKRKPEIEKAQLKAARELQMVATRQQLSQAEEKAREKLLVKDAVAAATKSAGEEEARLRDRISLLRQQQTMEKSDVARARHVAMGEKLKVADAEARLRKAQKVFRDQLLASSHEVGQSLALSNGHAKAAAKAAGATAAVGGSGAANGKAKSPAKHSAAP